MAGVQDAPAALSALQQLGRDKDLTAFLGKLQALNAQGAVKLMRDEDVRALLETGEAIRVAEARMADLEGRATEAQKALLGYAKQRGRPRKPAAIWLLRRDRPPRRCSCRKMTSTPRLRR
ncbi:hypothetical protein TSH58p_03485 [Azospirillum sp. TSH58]|uniref:hypothetical protein n=1 Tax=Azospirillum sp. TSH58 TaxID=664962 RepID=UPI000D600C39|nr:hypothetical protein [Azospirillum sp. TSH58]AWJ82660.1 hypothetical protein TSH58p_03485 [Azospirillum sp. TSH58]